MKNKKFVIRVGVCIVDLFVFYAAFLIINFFLPTIDLLTTFLLLTLIFTIIEKLPPKGKNTIGERLFNLRKESLDFDLATNIKFYEIPFRILSFVIPPLYFIRIFWVKNTEYGWIDKGVASKIYIIPHKSGSI